MALNCLHLCCDPLAFEIVSKILFLLPKVCLFLSTKNINHYLESLYFSVILFKIFVGLGLNLFIHEMLPECRDILCCSGISRILVDPHWSLKFPHTHISSQPSSYLSFLLFLKRSLCAGVDSLVRETELRQLRKASAEYEEQNSALRKHVETLQAAVSRLEAETEQQRRHSAALQHHLDSLRDVLANSFAHLPLPGDQHSSSFRIYSDHLRMDQIWKYWIHPSLPQLTSPVPQLRKREE